MWDPSGLCFSTVHLVINQTCYYHGVIRRYVDKYLLTSTLWWGRAAETKFCWYFCHIFPLRNAPWLFLWINGTFPSGSWLAAHSDRLFDLPFSKNGGTGGREEGEVGSCRGEDNRRKKAVPALLLLFILKVCKVIKILLRLFSKHLSPIFFLLSHTL